MTITSHPKFLRNVLIVDALTCLAAGLTMTSGGGVIATITQIPVGVLFYTGLSLFPVAAFIAFVATRSATSGVGVWLVIIGNVAWVVAGLWLMLGGSISLNALGYAFIAAQTFPVAVLAELEYVGLRHATAAACPAANQATVLGS